MKKLLIFIVFYFCIFCCSYAQQWTTYSTVNGLVNNKVSFITQDSLYNMWFATFTGGVSKFDGTNWINYTTVNGLKSNNVLAISFDNIGNLWVATGNGVSKYNGTVWKHYSCVDGLADSVVSAVVVDNKGIKWFGGLYNGITSYNDTIFKVHDTTDGMPIATPNGIRGIVVDRNNVKWFATLQGLLKYNDTTWSWYLNNSLVTIENMAVDTMGYVWVGTTLSGATVFNGNTFHTYMQAGSGLPDDRVCAIGVDK